ncbi:MAG: GHKL domain-containing protein [Lachnospiraceae bacterium]|nr:GHKL domain-containing protein [Lachnospiraceae bacterium]
MKLKRIQIIFLAAACIMYACFLMSFISMKDYLMLGSVIVMGIFFLLSIMFGLPKDEEADSENFDEYGYDYEQYVGSDEQARLESGEGEAPRERVHVNSLIDQLAERREDLEAAQSDIKSRDEEIDRITEKYEKSMSELQELNVQKQFLEEKITALEKSLEVANKKLEGMGDSDGFETILPDAKNDPPVVLNIGEAAQKAAQDLEESARNAGISIRTVSTDATLMVKASPTMIDVLFKNIIDNAIKYMSKEGTLQITISRIEQELFIVMKDNGEGLSADQTEHIFELNYQGSNRISGNGLGLAQARAIVEYYGGMIYARSSVGAGMGIYIHLPSAI